MKIKVGFLFSYDFELLKNSIPAVYESTEEIFIAKDIENKTWSGNIFETNPSFFDWLDKFDTENKITLYEDNFYDPSLTSMQNDSRERNMLAKRMGNGFHIQIDADEYAINFKKIVSHINSLKDKFDSNKQIQICGFMKDIFKKTENGFLLSSDISPFYLGTNKPNYTRARKNKNQEKYYLPFLFLHQTLGRSEEELKFKLRNWGHNNDFDVEKYIKKWMSVNENNFTEFKHLHHLDKKYWKTLEFVPAKNIEELLTELNSKEFNLGPKWWLKNKAQQIKHFF